MKTKTKVLSVISTLLIIAGGIIFTVVMFGLKWDFKKLSTVKYETNEYVISESFENISILTKTADVSFELSDGETKIVCFEEEKLKHAVSVKDGTLAIEIKDTRKFLDYVGIDFNSPKITLYLPSETYNKLTVSASTGDVSVDAIKFSEIDVSVSTGKVNVKNQALNGDLTVKVTTGKTCLENVTAKNIYSSGSTGDITLTNVIAEQKIEITRTTGDVCFDGIDGSELSITVSTGSVEGSVLTEKIFITKATTGSVSVPETTSGGTFKIKTTTGDISVSIKN